MAWYPYSYKTAFDPISGEKAPAGSVGEVYAVGDTAFTAPLETFDLTGLPVALEVQGDVGYVPSFQVEDNASVIWKSGDYVFEFVTSMPLPGPQGANVVGATDNGDGTMMFDLSNGESVGPVNIPEGPQGERGPAGYNATGAVEDQETLADYVTETAGTNPFSEALDGKYANISVTPDGGAQAVGKGELIVNALDHGATGDGVIDDTAALQAAVSAAKASGTGRLFIPPRTYAVTGELNFADLIVDAHGATFLWAKDTSGWFIRPRGSMELRGCTIDGNKANLLAGEPPRPPVYSSSADSQILRGVTVKNSNQHGIHFLGPTPAATASDPLWPTEYDPANASGGKILLEDCNVEGSEVYGAYLYGHRNIHVIRGDYSNNLHNGVYVKLCRDVTIDYPAANNNGWHGILNSHSLDVIVNGAQADDNAESGVTIGGGTTDAQPSKGGGVYASTCRRNGKNGITADITRDNALGQPVAWGGVISGNVCEDNTTHGITLNNTGRCTVTGNQTRRNGSNGIQVNAEDVAVAGNVSTQNGTYGIGFFDHGLGVRVGVNTVTSNTGGGYVVGAGVTTAPKFAQVSTTPPA